MCIRDRGTFSMNDKIEERKQQSMEHVHKMEYQRLVKRAVDYKPVGRRAVGMGRPCKR